MGMTDESIRGLIGQLVKGLLAEGPYIERAGWEDYLLGKYGVTVGDKAGYGAYSTVFHGTLSSGRPVVIKLADDTAELIPYRRIKEVRDRCPESVRRHLPEIVVAEHVPGKIFSEHSSVKIWSLIIMERLWPLPAELKGDFFAGMWPEHSPGGEIGRRVRDSRNRTDTEIMIKAIHAAVDNMRYPHRSGVSWREIVTTAEGAARRGVSTAPAGQWRQVTAASFSSGVKGILGAIGDDVEQLLRRRRALDTHDEMISEFVYNLVRSISETLRRAEFPINYTSMPGISNPGAARVPGLASLLRSLHVLAKMFPDLKWRDVHFDNMMVRRDGTIVISDVGMFR